jgi:hypothetical protein
MDDTIPDLPCADALESVTDYEGGFHLRNIEGPRPILNWQAGVLVTEMRSYRDPSMSYPFHANVSLFLLCGYGHTRHEALAMAKLNRNGGER